MTFLLVGHGGFWNRGCEAIVQTTVKLLREQFGRPRIILASFAWREDRASGLLDGVEIVPHPADPRWSKAWLKRHIGRALGASWTWKCECECIAPYVRESDALLLTGGDNLSMDYGYPARYLNIHRLARDYGVPVVIWGASIGPFPAGPLEQDVMADLRQAALITSRESLTTAYLADHDVTANVQSVADPAFLLEPQQTGIHSVWPSGEGVLGLNVSPLLRNYVPNDGNDPTIAAAIALAGHAIDDLGMGVLLIPHVTKPGGGRSNDHTYMQEIRDAVNRPQSLTLPPQTLNAAETKHLIARCQFLVAARTHATIAGFSSGVPTVSLAYSRKAVGLNTDLFGHTRYLVDTHKDVSGPGLIDALGALIAEEAEIRDRLTALSGELCAQARHGVERLAEVLA